jgi:hypothetical protein
VAIAVGLAAGTLLTPPLARLTRALSVYGAQTPPITWPRAAIVVAVATSVVLFATVRPALRGVRHSTLRSLGGSTRPPRPAGRLMRAVARLPLPLPIGLGLRAATRRRGRFVANTFGLSIGIALVIAGLALRTGVDSFRQQGLSLHDPDPISRAASIANLDRLSTLGFTIAAFLIALAVINAIIAAVFSADDSAPQPRHPPHARHHPRPDRHRVPHRPPGRLPAHPAPSASPSGSPSTTPSEAKPSTRSNSPRSPTSPPA